MKKIFIFLFLLIPSVSKSYELSKGDNYVVKSTASYEYKYSTILEEELLEEQKDDGFEAGINGVYLINQYWANIGSLNFNFTHSNFEHWIFGFSYEDEYHNSTATFGRQSSAYDLQAGKGDMSFGLGGLSMGGKLGGGIIDNNMRFMVQTGTLQIGVSLSIGSSDFNSTISSFSIGQHVNDNIEMSIGYLQGDISLTEPKLEGFRPNFKSNAYTIGIIHSINDQDSYGVSLERVQMDKWTVNTIETSYNRNINNLSIIGTLGYRHDSNSPIRNFKYETIQGTLGAGYELNKHISGSFEGLYDILQGDVQFEVKMRFII